MSKSKRLTEYVKRYAKAREISVEEAWGHAIVRAFAEWLNEE